MIKRTLILTYGIVSYAAFFATILYAMGFISGFLTPTALDGPPQAPFWVALLTNLGLLTLFAVQHSVMARRGFKKMWTRIIPKEIERSTYVLLASACLMLLFALWEPMGVTIWSVESALGKGLLYSGAVIGWAIVFLSTFLINHFDLFGLRQVWLAFRGREYTPLRFDTPILYDRVRHPLYLGFMLAFWLTPTMTLAHLVFALMCTVYILGAIQLEERDLIHEHGESYLSYRRRVPMIIPALSSRKGQ